MKEEMSTLEEALRLISLLCCIGLVAILLLQWIVTPKGLIAAIVLGFTALISHAAAETVSNIGDEETKERIKGENQ